jgi:hypothetical protein
VAQRRDIPGRAPADGEGLDDGAPRTPPSPPAPTAEKKRRDPQVFRDLSRLCTTALETPVLAQNNIACM